MVQFNNYNTTFTLDKSRNTDIHLFDWCISNVYNSSWEHETFRVLESVKDDNKIAIDLGAWIGIISIWLSKHFKQVISVEADHVAVNALRANLETSNCNNVKIIDKPIYNVSDVVMFGTNEYDRQSPLLGWSISHIKSAKQDYCDYLIDTITFNDLSKICDFNEVGFVKCDIEGNEEYILEDMINLAKKYKWKLWVEFHINWWHNKDISNLQDLILGYRKLCFNSINNEIRVDEVTDNLMSNPSGFLYIEY